MSDFMGQLEGMKNVFVWLLLLGIVSALMTHFVDIFNKRQVADMGFYFMYLLFSTVLLKCFGQAADTAGQAMGNVILFVKLLVPALWECLQAVLRRECPSRLCCLQYMGWKLFWPLSFCP